MENQTINPNVIQPETNIINRVIGIITKPAAEWEKIKEELPNVQNIITTYVLPLLIVSGICTMLGYALIGNSTTIPFVGTITQIGWSLGIKSALISVLSSVIAVFISALIINALATSFRSEANFGKSVQLVSYSFTPSYIGGILSIVPAIGWIGTLFGLYGLYLMYLGLMPLMKTPKENAVGYLVVSILVIIVSYVIISLILGVLLAFIFIV